MPRIECVVFDWAGTTVDFGSLSPVSAFREAFRHFGVDVTEEETRAPMGLLKIDHIRAMLAMPGIARRWQDARGTRPTDDDAKAVYDRFEPALMTVLERHCDLKPHLLEAVAALRESGVKIGSTTGFTRTMMEIVSSEAARAGYRPDLWVTAEDVGGFGRPWPFMIFKNMQALGASCVSRVLKVGDTVSDMAEAQAAGVVSVAVLEGSSVMGLTRAEWDALDEAGREAARERTRRVFENARARFIINNLSELPVLVEAMNAD